MLNGATRRGMVGWAVVLFLAAGCTARTSAETLDVTAAPFNAAADGRTKDTQAIQAAIDAAQPGDTVLLKAGKTFLTGPIYLKSHLTFRVDGTLLGSTDKADFKPDQPNRWEGLIRGVPKSLINAGTLDANSGYNVEDITICGTGLIDPQGRQLKANGISINNAIQINNCDGFTLTGDSEDEPLSIREPTRWCVHPIFSTNLVFQYLDIDTSDCPRNGDGIDIDSCTHVTIRDSRVYAQDDCIALKSGKGIQGYNINRPTSHVTIENMVFECVKWSAVSVGTEASGGVHHVEVRNCTTGPKGVRKHFFYMKTNPSRGERSRYHDISIKDCRNLKTGHALTHVDTDVGIVYTNAPGTPDIGGNIVIQNVSTATNKGVHYNGTADIKVHDITFIDCDFGEGDLYGNYCEDITFRNCRFGGRRFENSRNIVFE